MDGWKEGEVNGNPSEQNLYKKSRVIGAEQSRVQSQNQTKRNETCNLKYPQNEKTEILIRNMIYYVMSFSEFVILFCAKFLRKVRHVGITF